jgi:hypothetical protein
MIGCRLLAIGYWLLDVGYWLCVVYIGCCLLAVVYCLFVVPAPALAASVLVLAEALGIRGRLNSVMVAFIFW